MLLCGIARDAASPNVNYRNKHVTYASHWRPETECQGDEDDAEHHCVSPDPDVR